jgi:hypothetical protein
MSNVYYLPVPAASAIDISRRVAPRLTWRQALRRAGTRLWFAWTELRQAFRPPIPPPLAMELEAVTVRDVRQQLMLREHAALLGATVSRPAARIFDFEAARARRASS